MTKATKLTKLDTKGVAIVDRGANNKRFCLAKADGTEVDLTFEEMVLEVVKGGEMPLDEKAIEDMGARSGLDPQAIETFKAIMKLRHVYRDNAAFNGLLKTMMTQAPQGQAQQPGAPGMQPGGQPGAPGAQPGQAPGQQPGAQQAQPGAHPGAPAPGAEGKPPFGQSQEGDEGEGEKPPFMSQSEADPSAFGVDEPDEKKKEKAMDAKKQEELKKAADDAIAKAADLEAQITAQGVVIKAQETAFKAQAEAVKKMQDDLRLAQWVTKAEKELSHIPGETAESLGKQLFDIDSLNAEMAKKTFDSFKKTAEIVKASGLFKPSGFSGQAPQGVASAEQEFDKAVAEVVSKTARQGDTSEVSRARAEVAVAKSQPGLYKRYCDERETMARRAGAAS